MNSTDFDWDDVADAPTPAKDETPAPDSVQVSANGFFLTFNLPELLEAVDYRSYGRPGYGDEEEPPEPSSLRSEVVYVAGVRLAKDLLQEVRADVKNHVRDAVQAQVSEVVAEALTNPVQMTNSYGSPIGEPKALRDLIMEQAEVMMRPNKDPYTRNGNQSPIQKIISDQITQAFANDLKAVTEQARKEALAAVKESAASVIADTIQRATRGL